MADILLDEQSHPSTPSAGQGVIWPDSTSSLPAYKSDGGRPMLLNPKSVDAFSVADQTLSSVDTYITGSGILIPSFGLAVGMSFRWTIPVTKTAGGLAAPIVIVRTGTLKTTGDTARVTITGAPVQTAVAGGGQMQILVTIRTVSATGVIHGNFGIAGPVSFGGGGSAVSAGFDNSAMAGLYIGLSVNPGSAGVWTAGSCLAELVG